MLCGWTLYAHVSTVVPLRIKLNAPAPTREGSVSLPLDAASRLQQPWLVVVCRLVNSADTAVEIEARIDSRLLTRVTLLPTSSVRVDLAWPTPSAAPPSSSLNLVGARAGWRVESAELANLHGFSRGLLNFVVLPARRPVERAPVWLLVLGFGGTALILLVRSPFSHRALWWAHAGSVAVMLALFATASLSPVLSPYRIVFEPRTFFLGLAILVAPSAFMTVRDACRRLPWTARERRAAAVAACGTVAFSFFGSAMLQTLASYHGNYTGFLHVSRKVAERIPFVTDQPDLVRSLILYDEGYDGQFMYLMAFDPLLRRFREAPERYRDVVDFPPYRYGRIGFSLLTNVAAGGVSRRYPGTMLWIVVLTHFGLSAFLAALAGRAGLSPAAGLWSLAIPGFMASLLFGLPESLAILGLLAGVWCWHTSRAAVAALCFAAALLVRETGVILVSMLVVESIRRRAWSEALLFGASVGPLVAWRAYVAVRFFADFGWQSAFPNPGDFTAPFVGLSDLVRAGLSGGHPVPEIPAALIFPFILLAALVLSVVAVWRHGGPFALSAVLYGVLAVSLNYGKIWSHVPSGERGTTELFLCLLLVLVSNHTNPLRLRRALVALFVALAAYTFIVSPEAYASRAALLLVR